MNTTKAALIIGHNIKGKERPYHASDCPGCEVDRLQSVNAALKDALERMLEANPGSKFEDDPDFREDVATKCGGKLPARMLARDAAREALKLVS